MADPLSEPATGGREQAMSVGTRIDPARRGEGAEHGREGFGGRFTTPLYLGSILNPVNSSLIATALVPIAAALHVSVGSTAILISSLYVTCAVAQPAAGRLAEEFGPRRVFTAGILMVLAAGVIGALGRGIAVLIVARVLIGAGTSTGYPAAMLLIRRRAKAAGMSEPPRNVLGGIAVAGAATVAIGPAVGGVLIGWFGWQTAFWINLPCAALALALTLRWIPADPQVERAGSARELASRLDLAGMAAFAATLISLLAFLNALPTVHPLPLILTAAFGAALVAWELRAASPFLDVRLLVSNPALTRTYLRNGMTLLGTYVIMYGLTEWLESARGMSTYEAGIVLIPMGALSALCARLASRSPRVRGKLTFSAVLLLIGAVASLPLTAHSPVLAVVAVTALFGLTSGASTVANQTVLYQESPPERIGVASGLLRTFGYLGSIASAAITSVAFHTRVDDSGMHEISWVLIAVSAVVLAMTVLDRRLKAADIELTTNHVKS